MVNHWNVVRQIQRWLSERRKIIERQAIRIGKPIGEIRLVRTYGVAKCLVPAIKFAACRLEARLHGPLGLEPAAVPEPVAGSTSRSSDAVRSKVTTSVSSGNHPMTIPLRVSL